MGHSISKVLPVEVETVRGEIARWRKERSKRSAMPAPLWLAAAGLAQKYGIYRMSQALGLSYDSLKKRVGGLGESADDGSGAQGSAMSLSGGGFVEICGSGLLPQRESGLVEVEVCDRDGERMSVRVSGCASLDVAAMVVGFWQRGR